MKNTIKVAGVTFANPDGTNRQDILKGLGIGWKTAKLKKIKFEGEDAVEVKINGNLVGYVPRTQLSNPLAEMSELTAMVEYYPAKKANGDGKWYVTLSERIRPSSAEYGLMKKLCAEAKLPMPAYDTRAYAGYWAVVKA